MKTLAILLAAATLVFAQEKGAPPKPDPLAPGEVIRVVDVKQGGAANIQTNLGSIFPGITRVNEQLIVRGQPAVVDMIEAAIKRLDIPTGEIVRVVEVRNAEIRQIQDSLYRTFPGAINVAQNSIIIRGQPEIVARAEAAIKALDIAIPNVEFTIQLLLGSAQDLPEAKVPADLESTVRQLRGVFTYKSYRVLETQILRARGEGRGLEANGTLPGGTTAFRLRFDPTVKPGAEPHVIQLYNLILGLRFPVVTDGKTNYEETSLNATLDLREGQKTVIGKANLRNSEDAIILVITPRMIE
jgi:hypothetical protein